MALERKPVEEPEEPGYPSTTEYITGRRAFIGLLGLTALGVGGVYLLKRESPPHLAGVAKTPSPVPSTPQGPIGGVAPQTLTGPEVPSQPKANIRGDAASVEPPARPLAVTQGEMEAPKPPDVRPLAPSPGVPPPPEKPAPDTTKTPEARPLAPPPGVPPRPPPEKPEPEVPKPPAQPVAPSLGVGAPKPAAPQVAVPGEASAQPLAPKAGKAESLK